MSAAGADNINGNANDGNNGNNIIFTIKDTELWVPGVNWSARDNHKLSKPLSKGFERSVYWNESNFVGVNNLFVLVYLSWDNDVNYQKI